MKDIPLAKECAYFETGDLSEFNGTHIDLGGTAEATTDVSCYGSWSGKFAVANDGDDAYVYWTFDGQNEVYARFYCYFLLPPPGGYFYFMKFKDTSGNELLELDIDVFPGASVLYVRCGGYSFYRGIAILKVDSGQR